ncbi:MAG: FlgD immunoglobulin-like domain containing protein, partial [Candidatus Krumholzibacteria bacterium]|nr:FlgD immunoglobulin-like domain containing protein [Candidatus Krumholzibacteria bacterium]
FLNDAAYDTVGGTLGELALPVSHFDACSVSWRAVEVVFTVDFNNTAWEGIKPGAKVSVNGTPSYTLPATFNWDVPSLNNLRDDGVAPDATAGDKIYSGSVVFADSSSLRTEYKYLYKDAYECLDQSNREFYLDPDNFDAAGTPQVLALDVFQVCNITDVTHTPRPASLSLDQNRPNPFNPRTEIRFVVGGHEPRDATIDIFTASGHRVRSLPAAQLAPGPHAVTWDGLAQDGRPAAAGLYVARVQVGNVRQTVKLSLVK